MLIDWNKILTDMNEYNFVNGDDNILWKFGLSGRFSVKSVYNAMTRNDSGPYYKNIWKGKIPNKIKFSLWLMTNNAVLTKDNLLRRKWPRSPSCYFCEKDETIFTLILSM
jgi:hypothetical protein